MQTFEIGMLDGHDIQALRDGELDAITGSTMACGNHPHTAYCDPLSCMPVSCPDNSAAMSVWNELCMQNFGRTF
jgi:hypothetical protein